MTTRSIDRSGATFICAICGRPGGDGNKTSLKELGIAGTHAHAICVARERRKYQLDLQKVTAEIILQEKEGDGSAASEVLWVGPSRFKRVPRRGLQFKRGSADRIRSFYVLRSTLTPGREGCAMLEVVVREEKEVV